MLHSAGRDSKRAFGSQLIDVHNRAGALRISQHGLGNDLLNCAPTIQN